VIDVKQHAQYNGGRIVSPLNVLNNHHKTRFSSAKINNGWSYGCLTGNQLLEEFEDTKGAIRIVYRRRTVNTMAKRKNTNGQTTINKTYI
jgi:hypothetical protein